MVFSKSTILLFTIFSVLLLLNPNLVHTPYSSASTYNNSARFVINDGSTPSPPSIQCSDDGVPTTYTSSTTGASVTCDANSILYPIVDSSSGVSNEQWSATPVTYGLVGYWPLDDGIGTTTYDLSGNGHAGTLNCTGTGCTNPAWESGANCKFGDCLSFANASSSFISTSYDPSFGAMTLNLWINVSSAATNPCFIGNDIPQVTNNGFLLCLSNGTPSYWIGILGNGTNHITIEAQSSLIILDTWQMWTFTYDGSSVRCYIDGTIIPSCTTTFSGKITLGSTGINMGRRVDQVEYLNGRLDDIRIYDRALSASEIQELYRSIVPKLEIQITSGGNNYTIDYYHQFYPTFQIISKTNTPFNGNMTLPITGTNFGIPSSNICMIMTTPSSSASSCQGWVDNSIAVTFPQLLINPLTKKDWQNIANSSSSLIVTNAGTYNVLYYSAHTLLEFEYLNEIIISLVVIFVLITVLSLGLGILWRKRRQIQWCLPTAIFFLESIGHRLFAYVRKNWGVIPVFGFALVLICSAIEKMIGLNSAANNSSVYAFYLLSMGVALQIFSYLKYGEDSSSN